MFTSTPCGLGQAAVLTPPQPPQPCGCPPSNVPSAPLKTRTVLSVGGQSGGRDGDRALGEDTALWGGGGIGPRGME